jgi:hypothetical protein
MVNHDLTTALLLEKLLKEQQKTNTLLTHITNNSAATVELLNQLTANPKNSPGKA